MMQKLIPQDLVRFRLIPELIGRLPIITSLHSLDEEALVRILLEPKNSMIKQYQRLFELDNITLEFESDAYREIARLAIERKIGARGLRGILEDVLAKLMFDTPSDRTIEHVVINKSCINKTGEPTIYRNPDRLLVEEPAQPLLTAPKKPKARNAGTAS